MLGFQFLAVFSTVKTPQNALVKIIEKMRWSKTLALVIFFGCVFCGYE
jgi:hypothetical protein